MSDDHGRYWCGCAYGPGDPDRCQDCDLPKNTAPQVSVTVISAEGVVPGVLTVDEHGNDVIQLEQDDEPDEDPYRARGYCEDFPCCGHEAGDCYGQKYGSDEDIKARAYERMRMEDEGYFDYQGEE